MRKLQLLYLGLLFALGTFPAAAQTDAFVRDEIDQIKSDIVVIQRQLYRERSDNAAPQESVSSVQARMGDYDQMIRDMNGKVENIEYRLNTLEKKMEMIDKDIDLRFEQMKKQLAANSAQKNAEATPLAKNKLKTINKTAAKAPVGVKPKDLYETALTDLKNNKLSDAEKKLTQFLGSYPKDGLAGNAQYWLGEIYYKQQNFAKAAVAFKDGYSKYPEGSKGPDCLLKLGLSMKALNKKEEACTAFVNLPTIFSNVSAEISARAKKEAETLGCK